MRKGGSERGAWFVFGDVPASFLSLKQNNLTRRGLGEKGISFRLEFQVTVHHCEEVKAVSSTVAQLHIHRHEQRGRDAPAHLRVYAQLDFLTLTPQDPVPQWAGSSQSVNLN